VVATVLLLILGEASAGHIRAFLRIRRKTQHTPPLPIRSASLWLWNAEYNIGWTQA
jgi:hypothetical protein